VDWFVRYALWNKLNGYDVGITVGDVARRIGLKTNVGSSDELESRWIAKQLKPILNEMRVKAKQEMAG
jgi:hypothetical protein